ncbi:MAG: hypothetical protein QNJ84_18375 [Alphaproteobacteria bacterium]|nr:hypothetical protein [Alphaproteobacteria bacterium]
MRRLSLVWAVFLLLFGPTAFAAEPEKGPVLYFGSPENYNSSHYPAMDAYFEPIRRFFNGLNALGRNWSYTEPRQYAVDLNGDGADEYILEARVATLR